VFKDSQMPHNHSPAQSDVSGEGWLQVFADWEVQAIALNLQEDGDLVAVLRTCSVWVVDYEDDEAAIFLRAGSLADAA